MNEEIKAIEAKLRKVTFDLKDIAKRKRSATYKSLSKYLKNLIEDEEKEITSKQMDLLMELVDLQISGKVNENDVIKIVKEATK